MARWNEAKLTQVLEDAIGNVDPRDPKGKKRLRILEAATGLFVSQGYRKTSVGQVAAAAGVAKGTVYLYFETKVELLTAAVALEKRALISRMSALFEEDLEPRDRLKRYLVMTFVVANEMPLVSGLLQGGADYIALLEELPPEMLAENRAMGLDFVGEMVEAAVGTERWNEIEVQDRAKVLLGLGPYAAMVGNEKIRNGLSIERFATILAEMIVDGLVPAGQAQWK